MRILLICFLLIWTYNVRGENAQIIEGWNILSDNIENAKRVINRAAQYGISHLQFSHELVMNLCEMRDETRRNIVNPLIDYAHTKGIEDVLLWDHALYDLNYYPACFRTGPNGTLDLDNIAFWEWLKNDYRELLDFVPQIDGVVLTFIETGSRIEEQYSTKFVDRKSKLAAIINLLSEVICVEYKKNLYIRPFSYTSSEYEEFMQALDLVDNKNIILMMKETPHDFFLTHPNNPNILNTSYRTIIEFDTGNEFHGQGVIINTFPEYVLRRWSVYMDLPNVIGYVARTDRYGTTTIIDTPNEILVYALKQYSENTHIEVDEIYDGFISSRYGEKALPFLKSAFHKAYDIVGSIFYTLGTNTADHSRLNYDPYSSSYGRHVSGKWIKPPYVFVKHGINRTFHYWKDVIEHISPARFKRYDGPLCKEFPTAILKNWVTPKESINEEYFNYIAKEKEYGVLLAKQALDEIICARKLLKDSDYIQLKDYFTRTLLTAELHQSVAISYWGYRLYVNSKTVLPKSVMDRIINSLNKISDLAFQISCYSDNYPVGQWDWKGDAQVAMEYLKKITVTGWSDYGNYLIKIN